MSKFYTYTLGCKVNQAETDMLIRKLISQGHRPAELDHSPDWCILNTCTVTGRTDKKVRQAIRKIRKASPRSKMAVIGCFAQVNRDFLEAEKIDYIAGNDNKLDTGFMEQGKSGRQAESFPSGHSRPLIKVQEGCRQFCSYCIVPLVRGGYRSTPASEVIRMIEDAAAGEYQEAVITGIHLGKYGIDFQSSYGLEDLAEDILSKTDIKRIRLSSLEIGEISPRLIKLIAGSDNRICPHFHIPLQSGSDAVLKAMKRPYTREYFLQAVSEIREEVPSGAVTTDVMVGFPGESGGDFRQTMETVKQVSFCKVHVFKYSRREGTPAANMPGQVPEEVKKARSRLLMELASDLRGKYIKQNEGKVLDVVLEKIEGGWCWGTSENYIKVFFEHRQGLEKGRIYPVLALDSHENGLKGIIRAEL